MIDVLKEIIDPNVLIEPCGIDCDLIILKENSSDSNINKLSIKKIPNNCFAFTLDCPMKDKKKNYAQLSSYFNEANNKGINKSCDLVILNFQSNNKVVANLIDLKSDSIKPKKCEAQLDNSKLFLEYIFNIIEFYYDKSFEVKYVRRIIHTGPVRKSPVHRDKNATIKPLKYISLMHINGCAEIFYGKILTG